MTEVVLLPERVRTSIALGESHFREFKSALDRSDGQIQPRGRKALAQDIAAALVAFANADGGELLIGVEDNGEITGLLDRSTGVLDYLKSVPRTGVHKDTPLSGFKVVDIEIDGKLILYFTVPKSTDFVHLTSDGRCLLRKDLATAPIASEAITLSRQEKRSREYDREFVEGPQAEALDLKLVGTVGDGISSGMSPEKCLQYLDLAEYTLGRLVLRRDERDARRHESCERFGHFPFYCRAMAMRTASSGETRWAAFSAASAVAIWTPRTRPENSLPRGP
jgi:ATP-dependent DNA helicase RecG